MNAMIEPIEPDEDGGTNDSANPTFDSVLQARLSRRGLLRAGAGTAGATLLGSVLAACGDGGSEASPGAASVGTAATPSEMNHVARPRDPVRPAALAFNPVARSLADIVTVPAGYTATVLYRLGDPIADIAPYRNDGTDSAASFEQRAGDHHDGMHYFGLGARGRWSANASDRGLLVLNHENITAKFLHARGQTITGAGAAAVRPDATEVLKEILAHGVSVVEILRTGAGWRTRRNSRFNHRITAATEMELSGPARGSKSFVTRFSPEGTHTRGTVNNCANGYTPWGTYLTCEENWAGYFRRIAAQDRSPRTAKENVSLARYGIGTAANGANLWATATPDTGDRFSRWNATKTGTSADGRDDYRNAPNTFGWNVEIDPFDPDAMPKKRSAMGRFAHEGAWPARVEVGKPIVYYMGCDSRNEYIYKYVSNAVWDPADADRGLAAGDKYLDDGRLYVARFDADGTGQWLELRFGRNGITPGYALYAFEDQVDVAVNTRLAADAAGATKMDRPEWAAVDPVAGEVYFTLTNSANAATSSNRRTAATADAANPRVYTQRAGAPNAGQQGNVNGHIIRWREASPEASAFVWDVYLFGARADDDAANVNLSNLTSANDFSSPDGLWFSRASGLLWIETDDGYYTDATNCMLLAALPGTVGDGSARTVTATDATGSRSVQTRVGRAPTDAQLRRFLVGPRECEITGLAETPDGRALFVNVQHPGEDSDIQFGDPTSYGSTWPADPAGANASTPGTGRPRSATIVITKNDGGVIGL